jgi:hypothetical protein
MEYSNESLLDIVEEVDSLTCDVRDSDAEFIESMLKNRPSNLSVGQTEWILDMKERYLA